MSRLSLVLALLAIIAYSIALHTIISNGTAEISLLVLVFMPLLLAVGWGIFSFVHKAWWPLVAALLAVVVYYVVTGRHERIGLLAVNGFSHALVNLFLLWFFGRTLLHGREPLISQISRRVNGSLNPEVVDYTRHVTIAWCLYFGGQVVISLLLYLFAPIAVWSLFVNALNTPLLILMFIGEYIYRRTNYPNHPKTSILKVMEVYFRDFASSSKTDGKH